MKFHINKSRMKGLLPFILSLFVLLIIYWPLMHGTPIWDDYNHWFADPVMTKSFSYLHIFKGYAWPVSVSLQKFLSSLWQTNYFNYHLLNVLLHFLNSVLLLIIVRKFNLKYAFFLFLLFLVHPACVMTVGWMIQIKTLICMTFALLSLICLLNINRSKKWYFGVIVFFGLSLLSKSVSLPLVVLILAMTAWPLKRSSWPLIVPIVLIMGYASYTLFSSPETKTGQHLAKTVEMNASKGKMILKTVHYYFWQSFVPVDTAPVKGLNFDDLLISDIIQLFFLAALLIVLWKDASLSYLLTGLLLILPFLGIVTAPYMVITWVSDQHLYLALPAFLAFTVKLLERVPQKYAIPVLCVFIAIFAYKTRETTPYYENNIAFYEKSLEHNPLNVPITVNLIDSYLAKNRQSEAERLLDRIENLSLGRPELTNNIYWIYIEKLQKRLGMKSLGQ